MHLSSDPAARRRLVALAITALAALVAGLIAGAGGGESGGRSRLTAATGGVGAAGARLTLRQQVGQVLVSSFDGVEVPDYLRRRLRAGETAGVILFSRNVLSRPGLRRLTRSLQRAAGGAALVTTDQEGGSVRSIPFAGPVPAQPQQGGPRQVEALSRAAARDSYFCFLNPPIVWNSATIPPAVPLEWTSV